MKRVYSIGIQPTGVGDIHELDIDGHAVCDAPLEECLRWKVGLQKALIRLGIERDLEDAARQRVAEANARHDAHTSAQLRALLRTGGKAAGD